MRPRLAQQPTMSSPIQPDLPGILVALPEELGSLAERSVETKRVQGLEVLVLELEGGFRALACVGGVGKVMAARAAALLFSEGADGLLVCGVGGGLHHDLKPGTLVHCQRAIQRDLAVRRGRETEPTPEWLAAWEREASGPRATYLTADRAVFHPVRSWLVTRGRSEACLADMETAAAAAVAAQAGLPWAALRAVTDQPSLKATRTFHEHFATQAGRAASTVPGLLRSLAGVSD